jgi:PRTRC genetic system ThiF family protein
MFSVSDVGHYKSDVLVSRCNRYFGTEWISVPSFYGTRIDMREESVGANFIISCVDSLSSRREIAATIPVKSTDWSYRHPQFTSIYYWMDIGNSRKTGQIILGTARGIEQPARKMGEFPIIETVQELPNFIKEFPKIREKKEEPSCSLAESLGRQDLFINKIMATFASNMLWQFLKEFRINYRGIYINLETLKTQPIAI